MKRKLTLNNKTRGVFGAVGIAVTVLVIAALWFVVWRLISVVQTEGEPTDEDTSTQIDITDWQEYRHVDVGFAFLRPPDWPLPVVTVVTDEYEDDWLIDPAGDSSLSTYSYHIEEEGCQNFDCVFQLSATSKNTRVQGHGGQPLLFNSQGHYVSGGKYYLEYQREFEGEENKLPNIDVNRDFEVLDNGAIVWRDNCDYVEECARWIHFEGSFNLVDNQEYSGIGALRTHYGGETADELEASFEEFKLILGSFREL